MTTRRRFVASIAALLSACNSVRKDSDFINISAGLSAFQGFRCGISIHQFDTSQTYAVNAEDSLAGASLLKLLVAIAVVLQQALDLDQHIVLASDAFLASSAALRRGPRVSIYRLLQLMIEKSDNVAANALILHIGHNSIERTQVRLGLNATIIHDLFRDDGSGSAYGRTSAADVEKMLTWLKRASINYSAPLLQQRSLEVLTLMTKQTDRRLLESGLPASLPIANKTGETDTVLNDASIIAPFGRNPLFAAVLCSQITDKGRAVEGFRKIGYGLFQYLYPSLVSD